MSLVFPLLKNILTFTTNSLNKYNEWYNTLFRKKFIIFVRFSGQSSLLFNIKLLIVYNLNISWIGLMYHMLIIFLAHDTKIGKLPTSYNCYKKIRRKYFWFVGISNCEQNPLFTFSMFYKKVICLTSNFLKVQINWQ